MSYHKARPDDKRDPNQPYSTIMANGRTAVAHAEIDGKPILGGIQNALVEGQSRTEEEEKENVKAHEEHRANVKKAADQLFDKKTGKPKLSPVNYGADPEADSHVAPSAGTDASPEEIKDTVEKADKEKDGVKQPETVAAKTPTPQTAPKKEGK